MTTPDNAPAADVAGQFEREERYIVIKRKHLSRAKEEALRAYLFDDGIGTVECVVVESDWPEYETVWRMIEARVSGRACRPAPEPAREVVESILWHVEQVCGPLSRETCVVEGDDDYSVLRHNILAALTSPEAQARPGAAAGELERLRMLARANNDLARIRAGTIRRLEARVKALREGLTNTINSGCGCPCCNFTTNQAEARIEGDGQ